VVGSILYLQVEGQGAGASFRMVPPPAGAAGSPPPSPASSSAAGSPPAPLPVSTAAIESLGLSTTPGREAAARALQQQGAPVTRENLAAVERFTGGTADPARAQAAAWLLARGVAETETVAGPLVRAFAAPLAVTPAMAWLEAATASPLLLPADPLAPLSTDPGRSGLARLELALRARVERLLAADPLLAALDRLLARLPAPRAGAGPLPPELRAAVEALLARPADPELPARLLERADRLPLPAREALAAVLAEREREAIDRAPGLVPLREALGSLREAGERASAWRAVNLVAHARGEAVAWFEAPVTRDGAAFSVAVKVRGEGRGRGGGSGSGQASVLVRVGLSQIGLVTCAVGVHGPQAQVSFKVRDAAVRKRFQERSPELLAALAELGLAAHVAVDVRQAGEDEWLDWLLDLPAGERPGLDLRA
jgi:hypothetical protein